jgi:hypothetical protein
LKKDTQITILTEYAKKIQFLLQTNPKSYSLVSLRVNKYFIFNFGKCIIASSKILISPMAWYITKVFISAGIIVVISEISKKLPLLGSLIASLPLVSVLGMIWMYGETKDLIRIADHAEGTFWYVLPSLPMFLLMPWMLRKGISFPWTLSAGVVLTGILYFFMTKALAKFGMNL